MSYGGPGRSCPLLKSPILSGFPDTSAPDPHGPMRPFSDPSVARLLHASRLSCEVIDGYQAIDSGCGAHIAEDARPW